jgi:hypothetical protein
MSNTRVIVQDGALSRAARTGDTILNPVISTVTADAAATITAAQIAGGVVQYTGFTTAAKNLTTDTAVNILAAFTGMDVGDSISFMVSCVNAFAGTYVAGTGVTLAGRATTPASSYSLIYITKTSATTVTWTVL